MSRFTLNPHERSVASICTILCVQWQFEEDRKTLLAILKDGLPHCRQQVPVLDLVLAAQQLIDAKTVVEFAAARAAAGRALPAVLRADVVVRDPVGAR
jgi:hypothetical protein